MKGKVFCIIISGVEEYTLGETTNLHTSAVYDRESEVRAQSFEKGKV